jgi:hypothetical protein
MAITVEEKANAAISLNEYLEYVGKYVDAEDQESVLASAPKLHALSLNKALLVDSMNRNLESLSKPNRTNIFYSSHSFILGTNRNLVVRANIWPRIAKYERLEHRAKHVKKVYAYDYPHDHNFDFVTVGWFGPGYVTDIYEYDRSSVVGFPGERVPLTFLERTALSEGKTMLFRKGADLHVQYPPESISVSLNLLVRSKQTAVQDQFIFDVENERIAGYVTGSDMSRIVLTMKFASLIGNSETTSILTDFARTSNVPRVRAFACRAIQELEGHLPQDVAKILDRDVSPFALEVKRELRSAVAAE